MTSRRKKAFTLIELIVVVGILALLAAIAIPKYNNSKDAAKKTAHQSNVKVLESAALSYLATDDAETDVVWSESSSADIWSKYLKEWPKCPLSGEQSYVVTISGNDVDVSPGLSAE